MARRYRGFTLTDVGKIRKNNEDAVLAKNKRGLFAIADGMGGHNAGEVASNLAIATLASYDTQIGIDSLRRVRDVFEIANSKIIEESIGDSDLGGMGTTLTIVKAARDQVLFGHVGDSRLYLFGPLYRMQISEDHSLVWELFRAGLINKEESRHHPQKNIITRALGQVDQVEVDVGLLAVDGPCAFLLCSDGLSDMVSDEEVITLVEELGAKPKRLLRRLCDTALERGGLDNISLCYVVAD